MTYTSNNPILFVTFIIINEGKIPTTIHQFLLHSLCFHECCIYNHFDRLKIRLWDATSIFYALAEYDLKEGKD